MTVMRSMRFRHRTTLPLVVFYGLAMLLMPLAHRPVGAPNRPDLAAFALPDGTVPVLCTTLPGKADQPAGHSKVVCEACLLITAPGLIVAGLDIPPLPAAIPMRLGRAFDAARVEHKFTTTARARAPPPSLA